MGFGMHFTQHAARLVTVGLLLGGVGFLPAATSLQKVRTAAELEEAKEFATPRAFAKGDNVRIYYTNATGRVVFVADWKKSLIKGRGYAYQTAELKFDRTPPKLPKPEGSWREAVVVPRSTWTHFATEAAEQFTPKVPGHGIYVQTLATESVLFREATGAIKSAPFNQRPAAVVLEARYNTEEFAVVLAHFVEDRLRLLHLALAFHRMLRRDVEQKLHQNREDDDRDS